MPGIVGWLGEDGGLSEEAKKEACSALAHDQKEEVKTVNAGSLWLAAVGLAGQMPQIYEKPPGDILVVWGTLFSSGLEQLSSQALFAYAANPKAVAPGFYSIAHWCAREKKLSVLTDHMATRPVYYAEDGQKIAFASRLGAVLALLPERTTPDLAAWFDMLTFGALTCNTTWFEGVRFLPPSSRLSATAYTPKPAVSFVDFPPPIPPVPEEKAIDGIVSLVRQAVARAVQGARKVTVLSSGGIDSRLVWAGLQRKEIETVGVSFGPVDLPDVIVAGQICSRLGVPHVNLKMSPEQVQSLAPDIVKLSDATFSFIHGTGNLLSAREASETDIILDGAQIWGDITSPVEFVLKGKHLLEHKLLADKPRVLQSLLNPPVRKKFLSHMEMRRESFLALIDYGRFQDQLSAIDRIESRMYTQATLIKLGRVRAASPLYDLDLNHFVRSIPPKMRLNKFFAIRTICSLTPSLGKVVYTESGYPLNSLSNPYLIYLQKIRQRLRPTPLYDRRRRLFNIYGRWTRNELAGWLRGLFAQQTPLIESLIKPGAAEEILERHIKTGLETEKLSRLTTVFLWCHQQRI